MEIYSATEKDDILSQIISKDYISIDSNRGMSIIDEFLFPMGLIEKPLKLSMPDHYICVSTQKGKDFMIMGGFKALKEEQDKEDYQRKEIERLTIENLNLQNKELKYKEKIRHQESQKDYHYIKNRTHIKEAKYSSYRKRIIFINNTYPIAGYSTPLS